MKKRFIGLSLVSLGVLGLVGFAYWSNQPAVTRPGSQPNVKGAETPDYAVKSYVNDHYSTDIPTRFYQRTTNRGTGQPILLQQLWSAPAGSNLYADQLAIAVGNLPAGGLDDVADVQLRHRTDDYTQLDFSWLPVERGVAFERIGQGYELGIFMKHKGLYSTVVLSGLSDKKQQLAHEMQTFVNSVIWQ